MQPCDDVIWVIPTQGLHVVRAAHACAVFSVSITPRKPPAADDTAHWPRASFCYVFAAALHQLTGPASRAALLAKGRREAITPVGCPLRAHAPYARHPVCRQRHAALSRRACPSNQERGHRPALSTGFPDASSGGHEPTGRRVTLDRARQTPEQTCPAGMVQFARQRSHAMDEPAVYKTFPRPDGPSICHSCLHCVST
ncbi:hypothetical protein VTN00DRAFT_5718 [Thermoascus crustaceus]|uniref:uncharacterized protein n=1 Tax=Thermoascus crustaceus TaxID=5088 RepID=UPI00374454B2